MVRVRAGVGIGIGVGVRIVGVGEVGVDNLQNLPLKVEIVWQLTKHFFQKGSKFQLTPLIFLLFNFKI